MKVLRITRPKKKTNEMNTTASIGGFSSPFAFSKDGKKNKATLAAEKQGYTTIVVPKSL